MEFTDQDMLTYEDLFTFGLDCIRASMASYAISNWENSYTTPRSPIKRCTLRIYDLIKIAPRIPELKFENKLFTFFEGWFENEDRSVCDKDFETFADLLTSQLCMEEFNKELFIHFCVMIGHMAVRVFVENAMEAPDYAFCCIAFALIHFKKGGQFEEATWDELDAYCYSVLSKYAKTRVET